MRLLLPEARPLADGELLELYADENPLLRAGFVLSADGAAVLDGSSRALQSPADGAAFAALRAVADAVVVGAGTARHERYGPVRPRPDGAAWRAARGLSPRPPLVVVTRSGQLDPRTRAEDTVFVTCAAAPAARLPGAIVVGEHDVDLPAAVAELRGRGLTHLLCEGGPQLLAGLLQHGLVDELCLTTAAVLVGVAPGLLPAALPRPQRLRLRSLVDGGDGVLLSRYALVAPAPCPTDPQKL